MTVTTRISVFIAVLGAVFVFAMWLGGTFGPNPDVSVPHPPTTGDHAHALGSDGP